MDHIHTRVDRPLELRKHLLESAIDASDMLKSCDRMKQLVSDKDLFTNQIKELLKQLAQEADRLHGALPPVPEDLFKNQKKQGVQSPSVKNVQRDAYLNEREKLERDLEEIKRRMTHVVR